MSREQPPLVLQKHPKWTPLQVKAALVEHADPSVVVDPTTNAAPSVTQMGGGLLDANAALSTTAYATPTSITFGEINVAGGAAKQSATLTINDVGGGSGTWSVSVNPFGTSSNGFALAVREQHHGAGFRPCGSGSESPPYRPRPPTMTSAAISF